MQVLHAPTGMQFEFPDGTPDEAIQQHFQTAQNNMPTFNTTLPQQFMQGIQDYQQQQALAPPPVNGRGFIGLDPQQAQFMLQQRQQQQAQQQNAALEQQRNRLYEQRMNQESLEGEKDRALKIKLFNEELKNAQAVAKAEADYEKFKMEQEAEGRKIEFDRDKEMELLKQQGRIDLQKQRAADQRSSVQQRIAAARASRGGGSPKTPDIKTFNGKPYMWDADQAKFVPAPGVEQSEANPDADLDTTTKRALASDITSAALGMFEDGNVPSAGAFEDAKLKVGPSIRRSYGASPFETDEQRMAAKRAVMNERYEQRIAELGDEGSIHPRVVEQNKKLAEYEAKAWVYRQYGIPADVTLEGVKIDPQYKEQVEAIGAL